MSSVEHPFPYLAMPTPLFSCQPISGLDNPSPVLRPPSSSRVALRASPRSHRVRRKDQRHADHRRPRQQQRRQHHNEERHRADRPSRLSRSTGIGHIQPMGAGCRRPRFLSWILRIHSQHFNGKFRHPKDEASVLPVREAIRTSADC